MIKLAKTLAASAFAGAVVCIVAIAWIKIAPHPASMFFHPGWRIAELAFLWTAGSALLFAGAIGSIMWREIR
jgi:hypothetical protein